MNRYSIFAFLFLIPLSAIGQYSPNSYFLELKYNVDKISNKLDQQQLNDIANYIADLTNCDNQTYTIDDANTTTKFRQYILNSIYAWHTEKNGRSICLVMDYPEQRKLSISDAKYLLIASKSQFPVPSQTPTSKEKNSEIKADAHDEMPTINDPPPDKSGNNPAAPSDDREPLTQSSYPYYTLSLVQGVNQNGVNERGSAVQLTPYIYVTAAHVIGDKDTGFKYTNVYVYPHYNMPVPTSGIPAALTVAQAGYYGNSNVHDAPARDLGFIKTAIPNFLPQYPPMLIINSSVETVLDNPYPPYDDCPLGNILTDPYAIQYHANNQASTWFNGPVYFGCDPPSVAIPMVTAGYPGSVLGYPPNDTSNPIPFADFTSSLSFYFYGPIPHSSIFYADELYRQQSSEQPAQAVSSYISQGDSGGPIFAQNYVNTSPPYWVLLGIINYNYTGYGSDFIGGIAAGDFDYNDIFFKSNLSWSPSDLVTVTSPANGASYTRENVPDLIGTAGNLTSSLQWTSNIDGVLGTGGDVFAAYRLSPGAQTITATVQGSSVAFKTIHITIVSPASITATPNPVPIPTGIPSVVYTLAWTSPGYSQVDAYASIDHGLTRAFVGTAASPGSTRANSVSAGATTMWWLYPHGSTTTQLATTTVVGVSAPSTMTASPNPVHVPAGVSQVYFTLHWTAPGYTTVDAYASINGGPHAFIGSGASTGTTNSNAVAPGETLQFWLYPHGNTNIQLATVTVHGVTP